MSAAEKAAIKDEVPAQFAKDDAFWNGPRYNGLLAVTLAISLAVIYFIASVRSGDYVWNPFAHDPVHELPPAGW